MDEIFNQRDLFIRTKVMDFDSPNYFKIEIPEKIFRIWNLEKSIFGTTVLEKAIYKIRVSFNFFKLHF